VPLDPPPATRKIGIANRQSHDGMQMIGQNDDCLQRKRPLFPGDTKGAAQGIDMPYEDFGTAIRKGDGEK